MWAELASYQSTFSLGFVWTGATQGQQEWQQEWVHGRAGVGADGMPAGHHAFC